MVEYSTCCFEAKGNGHILASHRARWHDHHLTQVAHLKSWKRHLQDSLCLGKVPSDPLAQKGAIT